MHQTIAVLLSVFSICLLGVDNPDAPDLVGAFETRIQSLEKQNEQFTGGAAASSAYAKYETFLDGELNKVFSALIRSLSKTDQQKLKRAQRNWIQFRDAEFDFMRSKWTAATVGSSWTLHLGGGQTALIKKRILELLRYCEQTSSCRL